MVQAMPDNISVAHQELGQKPKAGDGGMHLKALLTSVTVIMAVFCMVPVAGAQPKAADGPPAIASRNEETLELPDLPAGSDASPSADMHPSAKSGNGNASGLPPAVTTPSVPGISRAAPDNTAKSSYPAPSGVVEIPSAANIVKPPVVVNTRPPGYDADMTLMFSADDMYKVTHMLKLYDSYEEHKHSDAAQKDDLSDLFGNQPAPASEIVPLPNLYLGSIVYYSPESWSISINGSIILSSDNLPAKEFYVGRISRREVEIIWKPAAIEQAYDIMGQITGNGKALPDEVIIDRAHSLIKLRMRPNQTFVIRELAIREGLIKSEPVLPGTRKELAPPPPATSH
jgi:hypothetical protein